MKTGTTLRYIKRSGGVQHRFGSTIVVVDVHLDDVEPYYTIQFKDGKTRQTTNKYLSYNCIENVHMVQTMCKEVALQTFTCDTLLVYMRSRGIPIPRRKRKVDLYERIVSHLNGS